MGRGLLSVAVIVAAWVGQSALLVGAEESPPVKDWQIKGIRAALKDGYPKVRDKALAKLANLPRSGRPGGVSRPLAAIIVPDLIELLKENPRVRHASAAAL